MIDNDKEKNVREKRNIFGYVLSVILVILAAIIVLIIGLPFVIVGVPVYLLYGSWLKWRFIKKWGQNGKIAIFVYSDSPNWKTYIEDHILPKIQSESVILNWSHRKQWKVDNKLEKKIFDYCAGSREFNPMAIIITSLGKVKTVRFWQAFRDFKHGKNLELQRKERELMDTISHYRKSIFEP